MSLHALAHHMQAKGRNGDSVLVHMTPGELHGLQALAVAKGGSLTINPETGLAEASFLSSLLPTLIGGALTVFSGGLINPLTAGLLTGAGYGLATGSLEKGLMAGLGAYGGAGLGAGITGTAAGAAPTTAAATTSAPATAGANTAINAAGAGGANSMFGNYVANAGQAAGNVGTGISTNATSLANNLANGTTGVNAPVTQIAKSAADPTWYNPSTWQSNADKFVPGMKASFGNGMEGLKALYGNIPGGTLPALGAYTLMGGMQDKKGITPADNTGMIRPYSLDRQQNPDAYKTYTDSHGQRMPVNAWGEPMDSSERTFFTDTYTAGKPYKAPGPEYAADGGLMGLPSYAVGGQPEQQAAFQAVGMNANYPMSQLNPQMYSDPGAQRPMAREVVNPSGDVGTDMFTGEARMAGGGMTAFGGGGAASQQEAGPTYDYKYNPQNMEYTETKTNPVPAQMGGKDSPLRRALGQAGYSNQGSGVNGFINPQLFAAMLGGQRAPQPTVETQTIGGMIDPYIPPQQQQQAPKSDISQYADGGIAHLGGYSDGGRLLRGPGDGVSDSIPASIGGRQPARLADGEFVVPARIVSEIGNGSTEAGARKLYAMMDRVQHARRKTVGKNQVAKNTKAEKLLPA